MNLERTRRWLQRLVGLAAVGTLVSLFHGLWRGLRRPAGRTSGRRVAWLRRPGFYLAAGAAYFGACALLWRPLPARRPPSHLRDWVGLALGTLLYFPGLALVVWGRLALGRDYFVSTTAGAQLFAGHRLVMHGPYAWVRHPMYLGLSLAGLGGLLLYRTWTWVLVILNAPALLLRARREEDALSAEFGAEWQAYAQRVRSRLLPIVSSPACRDTAWDSLRPAEGRRGHPKNLVYRGSRGHLGRKTKKRLRGISFLEKPQSLQGRDPKSGGAGRI